MKTISFKLKRKSKGSVLIECWFYVIPLKKSDLFPKRCKNPLQLECNNNALDGIKYNL